MPRRVYLCPPDHYQITYSINEWMDVNQPVNPALAHEQWETLRAAYHHLGVEVRLLDPEPGLPELTFPGDSIFLFNQHAVRSRFRHREREPEVEPMARRFAARGYTLHTLPDGQHFEGNAETIYWNGQLMGGCGIRSDCEVFTYLSQLLDVKAHAFTLCPPYFHFDVAFAPVSHDTALYYPGAFTPDAVERLRRLCPNLIVVEEAEARVLACNSVTVNGTVVMSTPLAPHTAAQLRAYGLEVVTLDLSEFRKAGGGAKCLTLEAYGGAPDF